MLLASSTQQCILAYFPTGNSLIKLDANADGLLNKRNDLEILLQSLKEKPDIIAITEFIPKRISRNFA